MDSLGFAKSAFGIDEVAAKIDGTTWGKELTRSQIETPAKYCEAYTVPARSAIIREGDSAGHLCIVIKGRVVVSKKGNTATSKDIIELGSGQAFGAMSLVDGEPRFDTEIVVMSDDGFAELRQQVP
jgi:CRP/FNR family cyclic AMP-dependent transcriptional regulator